MRKLSWGQGQGRFWGAVSFEAKRALIVRSIIENRNIGEVFKEYIRKYFYVFGDAINPKLLRRW